MHKIKWGVDMGRSLIANANFNYSFQVRGFENLKWKDGENALLTGETEQKIIQSEEFSEAVLRAHGFYICELDHNAVLIAVKCEIGKEPHPLISQCEAAVWYPLISGGGCWMIGVDRDKHCCFSIYP